MISGLLAIAKIDLRMWRRTPFAIPAALIPPLGMTLMLYVLSLAVTQQPVALVVEGKGMHSAKMEQIIKSDTDAYILRRENAATARKLLDDQEVAAVITIPADFDARVEKENAVVKLLLNNVNIDFSDDIRRSVDRSVVRFDAPQLVAAESEESSGPFNLLGNLLSKRSNENEENEGLEGQMDYAAANPYRISLAATNLRKTDVPWLNYQIIPALVLLVLNVGLTGTAILSAQDIERQTAKILAASPQKSWALIAGRILGGVLASLAALVPAVILAYLAGLINPPPDHWPALALIFLATAFCAAGLGAILGTLLSGSRTVTMAASVASTYMFFLGGGFTTIAFLPPWLRTISSFVPIRYAIDGMRQALFYPTLDKVPLDIAVLSLTAVSAVVIGSWRVRHSWVS